MNEKNFLVWFEPTNSLKVQKLFAALGPNPLAKLHAMSPNIAELREFIVNLDIESSEKTKCGQFLEEFMSTFIFILKIFP